MTAWPIMWFSYLLRWLKQLGLDKLLRQSCYKGRGAIMSDIISFLWVLGKVLLVAVPVTLAVAFLTLAERKVIGYIQVRIGPNRVGFRGILQPIADAVKLMFKEVIIPSASNKY